MSFLSKPLGLAILALVVYLLTITTLFMRSKDAIAAAIGGGAAHAQEAAAAATKTPDFVYWSFKTNEVNKLIRELKADREALQKREDELAITEARQASERKELERLRQEIETYRKEISDYLVEVKQDELKNLKTEVNIISGLQPASVVALFKEKSDDEVVKLMTLMKPDAIVPIMEQMMADEGEAEKPSARRAARLLEKLQRLKQTQAQ